ncbi:MAG TPA: acyloxyacyl hydrolase [Candidatus Hydrogenedentes bacterium]|nr:acyloxyacyl hydrolase [Candidatus Hydrogenedentota bacterium]
MKKTLCVLLVVFFASALPVAAEVQWHDGRWQLELSGSAGIHSGSSDRSGDYMLKGLVEYEVPFAPRWTLGLRALPVFVYEQDDRGEDTVWGGGAGLGLRVYSAKEEYRGWFAELGAHALGHKHRFADNNSNLNFLTSAGIGYKCKAGWHSAVRWEHISNAGIGSDNSGVNVITLGIGYAF